MLQETHLNAAAGEVWAAGLLGCRAELCPAITCDGGGQASGMVICFHDGWHVLTTRTLVAGLALEVVLRMGGPDARTLWARSV